MRAIPLFLLLTLAAACAPVRPEADFGKVSDIAQERLGQRPLWRLTPEDEAFARAEVQAVLSRGVGQREAVRLALFNNAGVQARFEEIGAARADVVQAGLPRNPSLGVLLGFPLFQGGPLAALAAQAMVSISDLAEVKDRTAKAQAELERDILLVGKAAMDAARDARLAWLECAYAQRAEALARDVARRAEKLSAEAARYRNFGLADEGRVAALEAAAAKAALEVSALRSRAAVAKARLGRAMGLEGAQSFELAEEAADKSEPLPDRDVAVAYAVEHSLEALAARHALDAARSGRALEGVRWLKDFEIGAGYDYDIEGNRTLGPMASLKLPLFDRNQAQRARADYLVRRAQRLAEDARSEAAEHALRALEEASLARERAEALSSRVLPPSERAAAWAARYARAMQLSDLEALHAELDLLRARLEHNEALKEERQALVRLEHALGGPVGARP
ncbi:Cobalt-zinc-cadmium resistance protein CzcC [Fundidesulfovibrio magnetotacticus]|uniref:Cobalt-zinc-cadmium resistance protein CzcC n=1 Tax=Fundidesulfovibrio magnetotacticus TaxID=2730080 RepID=A0A6V8LYQ4_9BACT|nr:TolC family protein [Fundidesulfovibrio magnetotacticus]GFK94777.1 Cobalt-zinc-cadmium resistance protein CzcC [Fundidesulfovibrio magnetotacticus]